jgi:3',5'-cyclic AMP phosphodiesterase CpdA
MPRPRVRLVVAHHPLLPPEQEPQGIVVGGARRALAAFAHCHVKLVLSGHLHRSYARLAVEGGGGPLIVQGGSATSTRLRGEPNSFNLLTVEPAHASIESMVWQGGAWTTAGMRAADL